LLTVIKGAFSIAPLSKYPRNSPLADSDAKCSTLGSIAEAAKAIGVTRQQLYNVINGKSAMTPEMAVRFEEALGGGADVWPRMQAAPDLAKVRQSQEKITAHRPARPV